MHYATHIRQWLCMSSFVFILLRFSKADVGTAARYSAPYIPTQCYGNDVSQIPSSNMFAAAGDAIWDNGASCGRQYSVKCLSASAVGACANDQVIQVKIVDYAGRVASSPSSAGATLVLSNTAFKALANAQTNAINVNFQQV